MSRNGALVLIRSSRGVHGDRDGLTGLNHFRKNVEIRDRKVVDRRALVRDGDGDVRVGRAFERFGIEVDVVGGYLDRVGCSCR